MKPKILAIVPGLIPSTIINVVTPIVDLHCAGQILARIALEPYVHQKDFEWCNLVILCRNTDPQTGQWFLKLLQSNKPYIYDIDDNFFELPTDSFIGKYHRVPERINMLKKYIRWADLVRVYSEPMFQRTKVLNPNVGRATGPVDWRLLSPRQKSPDRDIVKIVYATSRVNDNLSELFKPALRLILEKYQDRIEFYFLGHNPPEFKTYSNVFYKPLTLNYEQYLRYFSSVGFDIGLAPLLDDIFHRSKTNLKVREYGACHIAGIYSDVDVYSATVIHRKTGILVQNTSEACFKAMSELIDNSELRNRIQEQAYQFAQENFSHIAFNKLWHKQINEVLHHPRQKTEAFEDVLALLSPNNLQKSPTNDNLSELSSGKLKQQMSPPSSMPRGRWLYIFLKDKVKRLVSGLRSEGFVYFVRTTRFYIETFWMLIRIKLKLFVFSLKNLEFIRNK